MNTPDSQVGQPGEIIIPRQRLAGLGDNLFNTYPPYIDPSGDLDTERVYGCGYRAPSLHLINLENPLPGPLSPENDASSLPFVSLAISKVIYFWRDEGQPLDSDGQLFKGTIFDEPDFVVFVPDGKGLVRAGRHRVLDLVLDEGTTDRVTDTIQAFLDSSAIIDRTTYEARIRQRP